MGFCLYLNTLITTFSFAVGTDTSVMTRGMVQHHIAEQVLLLPQEKLHLQTDRSEYVAGEHIWFRAHMIDAVLHMPSQLSHYVYLELINPLDSVVSKVRVKKNQNSFNGYITLPETLPAGNYILRAYSDNLRHLDSGYFFHRTIRIWSPFADRQEIKATFRHYGKNTHALFSLLNKTKEIQEASSDKFTIQHETSPPKQYTADRDGNVSIPLGAPEDKRSRQVYVETSTYGEYIPVPFPETAYDIAFFPEGGYLLEGVTCRVAFKALRPDGSPAQIKGRLVDHQQNDLGTIETTHDGMGIFSINPLPGKTYRLVSDDGQEFDLPRAESNMYALQVNGTSDELNVSVIHANSIQHVSSPLYLLLHTRGMVHYMAPWDTRYSMLSFDTADFPSGIVQILLLDKEANPLSERLYFCRQQDDIGISFLADKGFYPSRSLVKATVSLKDDKGQPLSGSFSVSVTDDSDISPDSTVDIRSSALLSSELRGYIHNPSFYLNESNTAELDLLMMTHGWRRYPIPDVLRQQYALPISPTQHGMKIGGKVKTAARGRPAAGVKVSLFSWNTDFSAESLTDDKGNFVFDRLEFPDSLSFVVQAEASKGKDRLVVEIDREDSPALSTSVFTPMSLQRDTMGFLISKSSNSLIDKANRQYTVEHGTRAIQIREVEVSAKRAEKKYENYSYYMPKEGVDLLDSDDLEYYQPASVSDIIKYLPFVEFVEDQETRQKKVYIERMKHSIISGVTNYAVLVIDDIIIEDYDIDNLMDPSNIERIGVLKGPAASILGSKGQAGAIVITTKKGRFKDNSPTAEHIKWVSPLGIQSPAEFYSPRYETANQLDAPKSDYRTTIYWNPDVTIPSSGTVEFDFYTADNEATYTVLIEGVADNGTLIHKKSKIIRSDNTIHRLDSLAGDP